MNSVKYKTLQKTVYKNGPEKLRLPLVLAVIESLQKTTLYWRGIRQTTESRTLLSPPVKGLKPQLVRALYAHVFRIYPLTSHEQKTRSISDGLKAINYLFNRAL